MICGRSLSPCDFADVLPSGASSCWPATCHGGQRFSPRLRRGARTASAVTATSASYFDHRRQLATTPRISSIVTASGVRVARSRHRYLGCRGIGCTSRHPLHRCIARAARCPRTGSPDEIHVFTFVQHLSPCRHGVTRTRDAGTDARICIHLALSRSQRYGMRASLYRGCRVARLIPCSLTHCGAARVASPPSGGWCRSRPGDQAKKTEAVA